MDILQGQDMKKPPRGRLVEAMTASVAQPSQAGHWRANQRSLYAICDLRITSSLIGESLARPRSLTEFVCWSPSRTGSITEASARQQFRSPLVMLTVA